MIEIIAIGEEILRGAVLNTNTFFLSRELFIKGWKTSRQTSLSDDPEVLQNGLKEALKRSKIVITTGGLGSTVDDHTQEVASFLFLTKPLSLPNSVGQEPGLIFENEKECLILLPGVPHEMQVMFSTQVLPYLEKRFSSEINWVAESLHFCQMAESTVDPLLRELKKDYPDVDIGIYPHFYEVSVSFLAKDKKHLSVPKQKVKEAFASHFFSSPSGKIEEALKEFFVSKNKTLALAESCTGGKIASRITTIPGASNYFLGSFVVYSNELKEKLLHVKKETLQKAGAVSKEVVSEMIDGIFQETSADYAVAVSGIAGPTGGTPEKPVGTIWAAIAERGKKADIWTFLAKGDREKIILVTTSRLLSALWRKAAYGISAS